MRRQGMPLLALVSACAMMGAFEGINSQVRPFSTMPEPEPYRPQLPREKTAADFAAIAKAEERRKRKAERLARQKGGQS